MRLPDGAKSRALLLGTAAYDHLPGVPASRNNLRALADALTRHTGLPGDHCAQLLNAPDLTAVGAAVEAATREAEDLLLVYYSGHGLIDSDGRLHLALPQTSQQLLPWSGIPFEFLHKAIQQSFASTKVLILDCCFSGVATELLGSEENNVMGQIRVTGTFTLTSSPANSPSYAFQGSTYTAFTRALLELLEAGSPNVGELLTLNDIYRELLRIARDLNLPRPQKCGTHTADMLALAENRYQREQTIVAEQLAWSLHHPWPNQYTGTVLDLTPATGPIISAEDVRDVKFKTVRLTEGYDEDEVDRFLDQVALALLEPVGAPRRLSADQVRNVQFTTTRLRETYDMDEVDAFLDLVENEFERRQALAWSNEFKRRRTLAQSAADVAPEPDDPISA